MTLTAAKAWLFDEAPSWCVLALSGLIGTVIALRIFGAGYLAGTSAFWSWPVGDAGMMLTGWRYFTHEAWHWPLAHTYGTNGDAGINILYLDAIPLVAVAGKLVRSVVGGGWHPYGVWHLALYVLQAIFAALLARRVGLRGIVGGVSVAMLALSTNAFIMRFYHEGLNAHFVVLWAILVYLRTQPERASWRVGAEWAACISCAILIHPYLGGMTVAIAAAAFVQLATRERRRSAEAGALTIAGVVVPLFAFGYLPHRMPGHPGEFGKSSLNLLSPLIPYTSTLIPRLPSPSIQDGTGIQWDGSYFLGVGVWMLLVASFVWGSRVVRDLVWRHKALAVVLSMLGLYALSNRAYVGLTPIWDFELPRALEPLLENARATGRFFWPVGYALLLASCAVVVRRFGRRGTIIVAVAAVAQLVDSTACWPIVTNAVRAPWARELDWERWSRELAGASRVNLHPAFWCWWPFEVPNHVPERILTQQREVEFLAASAGSRTSSGRTGRPTTDCAADLADRTTVASGTLRPGEIYVLWKPAFTTEVLTTLGEDRCIELGDAFVCKAAR